MQHVWESDETFTVFWWGNLRERDHLEDQSLDRRIILKWIFRKYRVQQKYLTILQHS
jgi:hypothetical protein